MRTPISILFLLSIFLSVNLWAGTPKKSLQTLSEGEPLSISSEKMTLKGQEDKVSFEGNVFIQRGDVKITAGRVEVLLTDKDKGKSDVGGKEISQIEMMEKVEVLQGDRRVLAQKGVYNPKSGEIILTGNPAEMWEKGYHVEGRVIKLSLTQKRSFVEGSVLTIY